MYVYVCVCVRARVYVDLILFIVFVIEGIYVYDKKNTTELIGTTSKNKTANQPLSWPIVRVRFIFTRDDLKIIIIN